MANAFLKLYPSGKVEKKSVYHPSVFKAPSTQPEIQTKKIDQSLLSRYLPSYILSPPAPIKLSKFKKWLCESLLGLFKVLLKLSLRPEKGWKHRKAMISTLSADEVQKIYAEEALKYQKKHNLTTNLRDTWWRREVGFDIANHCQQLIQKQRDYTPVVLDLCTGIGLSLLEILKITKLQNLEIKALGLDLNKEMLSVAKVNTSKQIKDVGEGPMNVEFVRGDACDLFREHKNNHQGLVQFSASFVDCVSMMCGSGGMETPLDSFKGQLKILREGGIVCMLDMHRPIPELPTAYHVGRFKFFSSYLEAISWEKGSGPLVLHDLWGWKDPTLSFYSLPLVTYYDEKDEKYFGFEKLTFRMCTEPWWYNLPVTNIAKVVVKKVQITAEEFYLRNEILDYLIIHCK